MSQSAAELAVIVRGGIEYDCDSISIAIGEGCGDCYGCRAYTALSELLSRAERADTEKARADRLEEVAAAFARDVLVLLDALAAAEAEVVAANFDGHLARSEAAEAENARLREALGAYRSALRSGESESDQMRTLGDAALAHTDSAQEIPDGRSRGSSGYGPYDPVGITGHLPHTGSAPGGATPADAGTSETDVVLGDVSAGAE